MIGPTRFVVLVLAAIMLGCSSRPTATSKVLVGNPNEVIGHFTWTITECDTGKTIGQGDRDILLKEATAKVIESELGEITSVIVPLSDHFSLGINSSPNDSQGFGFNVQRDDNRAFCWEWFNVAGNIATKLQETGEVGLVLDGGRIRRADFHTDISLRILSLENPDPANPTWRILIAKGSYISMPR